jgi:iron(III) transport system substrate-binding protein
MSNLPGDGHSAGRRAFHRAALATLAAPLVARAQGAGDSPHSALYMYQGADRDAKLAAEAKKQREVVMYTSLNLKDSVPIAEAFEKKTGIKLTLWRASSEKVLQRAVTEARAGRFACDIIETNGPRWRPCYREKLLEEFYSPHFKDLPAAAFPRHRTTWPTASTSSPSATTPTW